MGEDSSHVLQVFYSYMEDQEGLSQRYFSGSKMVNTRKEKECHLQS